MSRNIMFLFRLFVFLTFVLQVFSQVSYTLPMGWFRAGSKPGDYLMGVDNTIFSDKAPSGFIKSRVAITDPTEFGTLMQEFLPKSFLSKRVQLSCFAKSENVTGWAGMWMRVDHPKTQVLDNMSNRQIKGTNDWNKFNSVLDVPNDANNLAFGILLAGEGEAWLDNCNFEVVDSSVPTTEVATVSTKTIETPTLDNPISLSF